MRCFYPKGSQVAKESAIELVVIYCKDAKYRMKYTKK